MTSEAPDPLLLGQRVVAILETGLRTATYKLATLMALIEHCIENLPENPDDPLRVPLPELAHRVLRTYWRQVRPFDGHELRQSTQPRARILIATNELRDAAGRAGSVEIACLRAPTAYQKAIEDITLCLAQQPLHRLQKLPGADGSDPFLYDDGFLHDHVSRSTLRAQRCHRAQARSRRRAGTTGRPPKTGPRDHVGRGRTPDEQVPRCGGSGRRRAPVRP